MNLNGPADWNTELPFVDVFRMSRTWISQRESQAWGKGPTLDLDARGWIKRLEPGCWAETPLCTIPGNHYPAGNYTVLYEGVGRLEASGAARVTTRAPGRLTLTVDPKQGGFFLQLRATDPANSVRNIRVLMPGFEKTYRQNPFHPVFLRRWQGMACLRFMDWMQTNNSPVARWADRPTLEDATWTVKGIPVEVMCDLANRLKTDAWFCVPHRADDDYVRRLAQAIKSRLAPGRKIYVEYSNEVWNGQFEQNRYAAMEGKKRGFGDKDWEAAWRYTGFRSVQIFRIFDAVFDATSRARLVRVLPTQVANAYVSEQIIGFQDAYKSADALAVAPYLSMNIGPGTQPSVAEAENWTPEQALNHLERVSLPEVGKWLGEQKAVADKYGLKMVAYEGGQHMVGIQGGENSDKLTTLLHAANRHPRLGAIYDRYFDLWAKNGGDLFCYFASVGSWSKWGSWGILEFYDDNPARAPKFRSVMGWAKRQGQPVAAAP
jgi:hypothetical protein